MIGEIKENNEVRVDMYIEYTKHEINNLHSSCILQRLV